MPAPLRMKIWGLSKERARYSPAQEPNLSPGCRAWLEAEVGAALFASVVVAVAGEIARADDEIEAGG